MHRTRVETACAGLNGIVISLRSARKLNICLSPKIFNSSSENDLSFRFYHSLMPSYASLSISGVQSSSLKLYPLYSLPFFFHSISSTHELRMISVEDRRVKLSCPFSSLYFFFLAKINKEFMRIKINHLSLF